MNFTEEEKDEVLRLAGEMASKIHFFFSEPINVRTLNELMEAHIAYNNYVYSLHKKKMTK